MAQIVADGATTLHLDEFERIDSGVKIRLALSFKQEYQKLKAEMEASNQLQSSQKEAVVLLLSSFSRRENEKFRICIKVLSIKSETFLIKFHKIERVN